MRLVGRAVVRSVVRLRVILSVRLGVVLVVRLWVRLVVRLGVRLIVRLSVRLKVGLRVRLKVTRGRGATVASRAVVLGATEGSKGVSVDVLMLQTDGVVILVVLIDISGSLNVSGSAEALATIVARGATNGSATSVRPESLAKGIWTIVAATRGPAEVRGRMLNHGRSVDMLVLDVDGVVILILIFNFGVEDTGHRHIEALALIISGGATDGSSTWSTTTLSLSEGSHSRDLGAVPSGVAKGHRHHRRARVHIGVLQFSGVVILVPLVDLGIGLDTSGVGADEATVIIIARRSTDRGTTSLGMEVMLVLYVGLAKDSVYIQSKTTYTFSKLGLSSNCEQSHRDSADETLHDCGAWEILL